MRPKNWLFQFFVPHLICSQKISSKTGWFDFTSSNVRPFCRAKIKICIDRQELAKRHAQTTNSFISIWHRHGAILESKHVQNTHRQPSITNAWHSMLQNFNTIQYLWHLHLNSGEIFVLEVRGTRARARSYVFSMTLQPHIVRNVNTTAALTSASSG